MSPSPRIVRLGDVHRAPSGVAMYVDRGDHRIVTMRPLSAYTPAENVEIPLAEMLTWPQIEPGLGGRVVWVEPREARA